MKQEIRFSLEVVKGEDVFTFTMPYASAQHGLGVAYEVLHDMIVVLKKELDERHKRLQEAEEKKEIKENIEK